MLYLLTIVLLVLLLAGTVPRWPYSRDWGYGPSGLIALVVVLLVVGYMFGFRL